MIPWLIVALVVVPLVVAAFVVLRRASAARPELDDAEIDAQFAAAEAFEAEWHEEDEKRFHNERLP